MKTKNLIILVALLAVVVAAAAMIKMGTKPNRPKVAMGTPLFSGLDVNAVEELAVRPSGEDFSLRKTPQGWVVETDFSYPAEFDKVQRFLKGVKDLKVGRAFGADGDRLARLELLDPKEEKAPAKERGAWFVLYNDQEKEVARLLVGKDRPGKGPQGFPSGQYVKKTAKGEVFLVDRYFQSPQQTPYEWMDKYVARVEADQVKSITCKKMGGEMVYQLERPEQGKDFAPIVFPSDQRLSRAQANRMAGLLSSLSFDKVWPAREEAAPSIGRPVVEFTTFEGLTYQVIPQGPVTSEGCAVRLRAVFSGPAGQDQDREQDLRDTASRFNAKNQPWDYVIGKWRCDILALDPEVLAEK